MKFVLLTKIIKNKKQKQQKRGWDSYLYLQDRLANLDVVLARQIGSPRRLDANGSARVTFAFEQASCEEAARVALYEKRRVFDLDVLGACQPASYVLLDHDAARFELLRAQLLQIGHLTCLEEDLCLAKLILCLILVFVLFCFKPKTV